PPLGRVLGRVDATVTGTLTTVDRTLRGAGELVQARTKRLARFVARNAATVEYDAHREPARRGELLILDPTAEDLRLATESGFSVVAQGSIDGLDTPTPSLPCPAACRWVGPRRPCIACCPGPRSPRTTSTSRAAPSRRQAP